MLHSFFECGFAVWGLRAFALLRRSLTAFRTRPGLPGRKCTVAQPLCPGPDQGLGAERPRAPSAGRATRRPSGLKAAGSRRVEVPPCPGSACCKDSGSGGVELGSRRGECSGNLAGTRRRACAACFAWSQVMLPRLRVRARKLLPCARSWTCLKQQAQRSHESQEMH